MVTDAAEGEITVVSSESRGLLVCIIHCLLFTFRDLTSLHNQCHPCWMMLIFMYVCLLHITHEYEGDHEDIEKPFILFYSKSDAVKRR